MLDAIAHIHAVGILHRDIKPANVVIEPDGTAKLIDFGIALPRDATALTSTGLVLGTERYAAPEAMAGLQATERSDLYSCGMVLRSCEGPCSEALRALTAAMTAKDPRDRPLSAAHALAQLERPVAGERPTEAYEAAPVREASRPERDRRREAAAAVLGLLAAAAIVALVVLGGGGDPAGGGGNRAAEQGGRNGGGARAGVVSERGQPSGGKESPAAETAPPPGPSAVDPASGAALNERGFAMIQAGEYEAAVPVLEESVDAFPAGTDDLDYAYALFNLGSALRLSGRPEEAIPILERRLEIPNQEGEVREELEAAYAEAGEPISFQGED